MHRSAELRRVEGGGTIPATTGDHPCDGWTTYWPDYLRVNYKGATMENRNGKRVGKKQVEVLADLAGLRMRQDADGKWHTSIPGCVAAPGQAGATEAHEVFASAREAAAFLRGFVRATQAISHAARVITKGVAER